MKCSRGYNLLEVVIGLLLVSILSIKYLDYMQSSTEYMQLKYNQWQKKKTMDIEKLMGTN